MAIKLLEGSEVAVWCPVFIPQVKMVVRTNRLNGHQFLGCPNWPSCEHTTGIPEDILMRAAGAVPLPGFEQKEAGH